MSVVTDVIVTTDLSDGNVGSVDKLNQHFRDLSVEEGLEAKNAPQLLEVTELYTRSGRAIQARIWIGAFNYMAHGRFLKAMRAVPWYDPDSVQLFVNHEHGEQGFQRIEWREETQPPSGWVQYFGKDGD